MRKYRFYTPRKNLRPGSSVLLEGFEANHARKALRLKKGDEIYIFNGEEEFKARMKLVSRDAMMAEISLRVDPSSAEDASGASMIDNTATRDITIFQALTKAKSFELVLEKLTELGISKFIPFESDFSVVKADKVENKIERWKKIILSACKQSERIKIPEVVSPITFSEIESHISDYDVVILFTPKRDLPDSEFIDIKNFDLENKKVAFIIGPEGGFSPKELEEVKKWNIKLASLGNWILRSETASIAAASMLILN